MTTNNNIKQQKEMKKHLFFWASLLMAGLALTACGGDDADDFSDKTTPVTPTGKQKWTVTVGAGVMTRGLNDDLSPNWTTDETVFVYYGSTKVGELHPTSNSATGSVILTGELDEANYIVGQDLMLEFHGSSNNDGVRGYENQLGTLEDIAANYDYMEASANITAVDNTAKTLSVNTATFNNLQSIFELTFTEPLIDGDVIQIDGGDLNVDVTPGSVAAGTPVYAAVPFNPSTTSGLSFVIAYQSAANEEVYYADPIAVGKTLQNGKHYTATVNINAVRLWEGGPCWAVKNIGATSKTDLGSLFAWGETATKASSTWENYTHCNGTDHTFTKYCNNADFGYNGYTDDLTELEEDDDVAYATTDGYYRIPSLSQAEDLNREAEFHYGSPNSTVSGKTTGFVGRSITLPNGEYWTRDLNANNGETGPTMAWAFYPNSHGYLETEDNSRNGQNYIRAIYE